HAVVVRVAGSDEDAAREREIVGEEALQERAIGAAEDFDVRAAARSGSGNDVRHAVAIDVANRHADPAAEATVKRGDLEALDLRPGVKDVHDRQRPGVGAYGEQVEAGGQAAVFQTF